MKGQTSLEFMVFIGVVLLMLLAASYAAIQATKGVQDENEASDARRVVATIAGEINTAAEIGDGYSHKFYIPDTIYGTNYSIGFYNSIVSVDWENSSYSLPVVVWNITGTVAKGQNTVRNAGGVVGFV